MIAFDTNVLIYERHIQDSRLDCAEKLLNHRDTEDTEKNSVFSVPLW